MEQERTYDLVVYGATGFTGKQVVRYIKSLNTSYKVAVAGRNKARLDAVLSEFNASYDVITADCDDEDTLIAMCSQTRVLLNCVGPFRDYGEQVVTACISAGCHYLDVCGEPEFMEMMEFMHDDAAEDKGDLVVSGCGFDSIPADLGTVHAVASLPAGCTPATVESFLTIHADKGLAGHVTTYECAVRGFGSSKNLSRLRKVRADPSVPILGRRLRKFSYPNFVKMCGAYALPFPGADASVVRRTQRELMESGCSEPLPVHYAAYFTIKSRVNLALFLVFGAVFKTLAKYSWGRWLLLRFPRVFSFGMFSAAGPSQEQLDATRFSMKFRCKGYLSLPEEGDAPNCEVTTEVSGPEPGYVATPIMLVQSCFTVLEDQGLPIGIHTPGAAFRTSSLIPRLQQAGIKFRVLETSAEETAKATFV